MDHRVDLPALYASREFADLTIIAADGEEFHVHRVVLGQYPRLKVLITDADQYKRRVTFPEGGEVLRLMIQWMYGVPWPANAMDTIKGRTTELKTAVDIAHVAEKYEITNMGKDAYATAGRVMRTIESVGDGLKVLRETTAFTATGVLQRFIIDRVLKLAGPDNNTVTQNRGVKRERDSYNDPTAISSLEVEDGESEQDSVGPLEVHPKAIKSPKKSARPRKPSEKAKELPTPRKKIKMHASSEAASTVKSTLHCVCRKPEDDNLVECGQCQKWFHPGCIGKGTCKATAYKNSWRTRSRQSDEKFYRESGVEFTCLECDAKSAS